MEHLFKGLIAAYRRLDFRHLFRGKAAGLCDEDPVGIDIIVTLQPLLHILQQALLIGAAVLLAHAHLAVLYLNAGPQGQHIGAQRRHTGAAAALVQIIQPLHQEADVQLFPAPLHGLLDLPGGQLALPGQLRRLQHQQTDAGGEVAAVHRVHIAHLRRRDAGVLIAGGHILRDVEMHHCVTSFQLLAEECFIVIHGHRRRGAHAAAFGYMVVDLVGCDVHTVYQRFAVPNDIQRRNADLIALYQLRGQIAGTVCGNFNIHRIYVPFTLQSLTIQAGCLYGIITSGIPQAFLQILPRPPLLFLFDCILRQKLV